MVCSVDRKLKFWHIFGLLSSKYTAVISIGSPPSLDTRYEFRHYIVTQYKMQIWKGLTYSRTQCFGRYELFIQQRTYKYDYVTFTSTCGTPLTATTLHLPGITKEAVPHSDPSTLGNAVESQYMEGIYKANTHARLIQQTRERWGVHTIPKCTFRTASHGVRRKHMLAYFYAEENNTLWRIYWRHNIPCETWEESPGSRTGHCAKQRCHIVMSFVQHHAWSLSNIAVVSKTRARNMHPLVINTSNTRFCTNTIPVFYGLCKTSNTETHSISSYYSCAHSNEAETFGILLSARIKY